MRAVEKALQFIKDNGVKGASVTLHLHYDSDEDYDYTGMHSINIGIEVLRYDEELRFSRSVTHQFTIDLDDVDEAKCREVHTEVYHIIEEKIPQTNKSVFIHKNGNY